MNVKGPLVTECLHIKELKYFGEAFFILVLFTF